ncbi:MAG: folate family ECF transporter S component [Dorea sp.]|nr:folate family ECF transporter S component [Dorea sp.]
MRKIKKQFTDSLYELKELRTLVAAAMLLAIIVVLGFYRLQLTDYIRIGFDSVAKELTGMLFGPVIGCMVGGLSDLISYIVKPIGGFFPGFTISAMAGGTIYGIILYKRPLSIGRIILANSVVAIVVNLLLNTYWLTLLYGDAYLALLPARAVKQLVMLPIDIILFYITAKLLARTNIFEAVRSRVRR